MPTYNGNSVHLVFDSLTLSSYFTGTVQLDYAAAIQDVTAGAGSTHEELAKGLETTTLTFVMVYDTTDVATYKAKLQPGKTGTLIYGPEGNGTGKPKLEQSCIIESVGLPVAIDKQKVAFTVTFRGVAAPTTTLTGDSAGVF